MPALKFDTLHNLNQIWISKKQHKFVHSVVSLGLRHVLPKVLEYATAESTANTEGEKLAQGRRVWEMPAALPSVTVKTRLVGRRNNFLEK